MITLQYKKIRTAALVLLSSYALVFFVTWLKLYIGIPCAALLITAVVLASRSDENRTITIKRSTLAVLALLVFLWAFFSGLGGFFTQKMDHEYRNVIFRDLIYYDWPVLYHNQNDESLVYYIGFWLLPALIGKLGNAIGGADTAWLFGRIALLLWSTLTIYTSFLVVLFRINPKRRKEIYLVFAIFVLFSGMDGFGHIGDPIYYKYHIEWWAGYFQFSSMSTQLCWVFNQALPAWLACAIASNEKNEKAFALIGLCLLPTSPLPLVGLAVYLIAFAIKDFVVSIKVKTLKDFFKNVFTPTNIISVVTLFPVFYLYYNNNTITTNEDIGAPTNFIFEFSFEFIITYIMFIFFEFLILLLCIKNKENRFEAWVITGSLLIAPLITVGDSYDFSMRASIPALFLLMILLMEYLIPALLTKKDFKDNSKENQKMLKKFITVMLVFCIGIITPFVEYSSSLRHYIETKGECVTEYDYMDTLSTVPLKSKMNFVGIDSQNAKFFKYIARK